MRPFSPIFAVLSLFLFSSCGESPVPHTNSAPQPSERVVPLSQLLPTGSRVKLLSEMKLEWDEERNEYSIRQIRNPDAANQKVSCKIFLKREKSADLFVLSPVEWTVQHVFNYGDPDPTGKPNPRSAILFQISDSQRSTDTISNGIYCNHRPSTRPSIELKHIEDAFDMVGGIEIHPN